MHFALRRERMVQNQLIDRGISDKEVISAFKKVERHRFIEKDLWHLAYNDSPLGIGKGQTISQPYMVAIMLQLANLDHRHNVLEIGTGSGYQTALLAEIVQYVYTVERINDLQKKAKKLLSEMGYDNIFYKTGDGTKGWEKGFPHCPTFDRIIVTAAAPEIPFSLKNQLAENGLLIIPAGNRYYQELVVIKKENGQLIESKHGGCTFVPLIGEEGWHEK
jgi:protein-L-isoaspartate(D-aspartate) O-methyltransferase